MKKNYLAGQTRPRKTCHIFFILICLYPIIHLPAFSSFTPETGSIVQTRSHKYLVHSPSQRSKMPPVAPDSSFSAILRRAMDSWTGGGTVEFEAKSALRKDDRTLCNVVIHTPEGKMLLLSKLVDDVVFLEAGERLVFDQERQLCEVDFLIEGAGEVLIRNATVLFSAQHLYTGETVIDEGKLILTEILRFSPVIVRAGGCLSGSEFVRTLISSGRTSPGTEENIGQILTESLTLKESHVYECKVLPSLSQNPDQSEFWASDFVWSRRQAILSGTVHIKPAGDGYVPRRFYAYEILRAPGGILGQFAEILCLSPFFEVTLVYSKKAVIVILKKGLET